MKNLEIVNLFEIQRDFLNKAGSANISVSTEGLRGVRTESAIFIDAFDWQYWSGGLVHREYGKVVLVDIVRFLLNHSLLRGTENSDSKTLEERWGWKTKRLVVRNEVDSIELLIKSTWGHGIEAIYDIVLDLMELLGMDFNEMNFLLKEKNKLHLARAIKATFSPSPIRFGFKERAAMIEENFEIAEILSTNFSNPREEVKKLVKNKIGENYV